MAYEFRLPDIGEGLVEAEIVEWRVAVGDAVAMDEVVVDVETDKAVVEIPTPVAGTVLHLGGGAGDVIEVGDILLVVGEPDEIWPEPSSDEDLHVTPSDETEDAATSSDEPADEVEPIVGSLGAEVTVLAAADPDLESAEPGVKALPLVRKLAKELGVDLDAVTGSGPEGRVTREDVTAAARMQFRSEPVEVTEPEPKRREHPAPGPEDEQQDESEPAGEDETGAGRRPMSRLRRTIAERMSRSWAEIPHVTTFDEVDATRLLEVRRALVRRTGAPISIDALVVKAVVPALVAHPDFNAHLDGTDLIDSATHDIGVAVDTPDGLVVAVVADAGSRSLTEVAGEIARLAEAARERKLTPGEMSGQTFTVSNIGAVGGGHGTPIVPYGTVGILSVGRAVDRPVARDGSVVVVPVMPVSLSYDHRVVDGAAGRRFLADVIENLTEPALFLAD